MVAVIDSADGTRRDLVSEPLALTPVSANGIPAASDERLTKMHEMPQRRKYIEILGIYCGFLILGLVYGVQGPSILDLQIVAHTDTATITRVFIGRSVGGLAGAVLSGLILERLDRHLLVGFSIFGMTVLLAILPWTWHVIVMSVVLALASINSGFCDAAGNVLLLIVLGSENGPWMQALHFIFAVGALLGPVLMGPFLTEEELDTSNVTLADNGGSNHSAGLVDGLGSNGSQLCGNALDGFTANCTDASVSEVTTNIWIPFLIVGVLGVLVSLAFIALYFTKSPLWIDKRTEEEKEMKTQASDEKKVVRGVLLVLVLMFYICQCTTEIGYQSYLFAYAVKYLSWSKKDAAQVTAALYAAFAVGRVAGIFLIKYIRPNILLLIDSISLVLFVAPLGFLAEKHVAVLWVCSIGKGWSIARLFATGITWMDKHIEITGLVSAIFMIAGSMGDMIGPVVLTALYHSYGLGSFPYLMLCSSISVLLVCIAMQFVARQLGERHVNANVDIPAPETETFDIGGAATENNSHV